jgi:uncharacterized membrane-anchored protein
VYTHEKDYCICYIFLVSRTEKQNAKKYIIENAKKMMLNTVYFVSFFIPLVFNVSLSVVILVVVVVDFILLRFHNKRERKKKETATYDIRL